MASMMMTYEHAVDDSSPGSPPDLSESKSSHSSSFNSNGSDDNTDLADVGNFEDITLDDNEHLAASRGTADLQLKKVVGPYGSAFPGDLRHLRHKAASTTRLPSSRNLFNPSVGRDVLAVPKSRPTLPDIKTHGHAISVRTANLGLLPEPQAKSPRRSLGTSQRPRSKSPNLHLDPRDPKLLSRPRRSSWQANHRKSAFELELECDEDDGDDIPAGLILDNVPISPRPPMERTKSQASSAKSRASSKASSKNPSPERPKERVRSVGNGTPPVAVARGSLRSPMWKSDASVPGPKSPALPIGAGPMTPRAKSWTAVLASLNADAKDLTEKLEEHASEQEHRSCQRSSTGSMPNPRKGPSPDVLKPRVKSALPELPPLRRTDMGIDPLPISKEKEAVLSRTRPSWLPPKDPVEERRHLREYQQMMTRSQQAEVRRDVDRRVRSEHRDQAADGLQHIWEQDVLPRWNTAVRERRTRELWWRGIAPRSRGQVWSRAIGNELGLNETSYLAALRRAQEVEGRVAAGSGSAEDVRQAGWFATIRGDVEERTWKDLRIFQAGAPLHQGLVDVLTAYAMYRSDIGYVTGCNVSTTLLLQDLGEASMNTDKNPDHRRPPPPQPPLPGRHLHLPRQRAQPAPPAEFPRLGPGRQDERLQPPPADPRPQERVAAFSPYFLTRARPGRLPGRHVHLALHLAPGARRGRAAVGRLPVRGRRDPGPGRGGAAAAEGGGAAGCYDGGRCAGCARGDEGGRCEERAGGEVDSGGKGGREGLISV